jgi:hypothetical protein
MHSTGITQWVDCGSGILRPQIVDTRLVVTNEHGECVYDRELCDVTIIGNVAAHLNATVLLEVPECVDWIDINWVDLDHWFTIHVTDSGAFVVNMGEYFDRLYYYRGAYFMICEGQVRTCVSYKLPDTYNCDFFRTPSLLISALCDHPRLNFVEDYVSPFIETGDDNTFAVFHFKLGLIDNYGNCRN